MKKRLAALLFATATASAQVQAPMTQAPVITTTDTKAVLALLQGNIDMYGTNFGSVDFQRGILQLAQQKAIKVRVMTAPASAQNMKPLKAVGAAIYTVPANFTNSLIIVQGGPVIIPTKNNYQIVTDVRTVAAMSGLMTQYWQIAKTY